MIKYDCIMYNSKKNECKALTELCCSSCPPCHFYLTKDEYKKKIENKNRILAEHGCFVNFK